MKINLLFIGTVALTLVTCSQAQVISRDPCKNFVCQNDGWCVARADAAHCLCAPGFTGSNCQSESTGGVPRWCPVSFGGDFFRCCENTCRNDLQCPEGNKCCSDFWGRRRCTAI